MKKNIFSLIIFFIVISQSFVVYGADNIKDKKEKIITYQMKQANVSDTEEYLDIGLMPLAAKGGEWMVIYLHECGYAADYEKYIEEADRQIEMSGGDLKPTDYERIGLLKSCLSVDRDWINEQIIENTGADGIMSLIYGLILAESANYEDAAFFDANLKRLVSMQLPEGAFSISQIPDPDVTAMALLCLAPFKEKYADCIEKALLYLSNTQRESGAYSSFGVENAESTAQVLIALCALKIDYKTDLRFIKEGNTVLDGMELFEDESGGFKHSLDTAVNKMSTIQALSAYVAIDKFENGNEALYQFSGEKDKKELTVSAATDRKMTGKGIKIIVLSALAASAFIYIIIMLILGRMKSMSTYIPLTVILLLFVYVGMSHFQTREEYYSATEYNGDMETYVSIRGYNASYLSETRVLMNEGESVFEQLKKITSMQRYNLDYSENPLTNDIYVRGINGLAEFMHGSMSGWIYKVNGKAPDISCSSYKLQDGDVVEWIYTVGGDR